jgi:hypothetical protein
MKSLFRYVCALSMAAAVFSCEKDNREPPQSQLTGRVVYQGEPIEVERNQVPFQLYQYGFGRVGPIDGSIAQDGSYSALLFDGEYKFIIPNGQGPFIWKQTAAGTPDSVTVTMNGSQQLDLEVTPYYMVRNTQISASGGNVNATFALEKIITDANAKDIEEVNLYINKTQFVSGGNQIASSGKAGADISDMNNIALSVAIPSIVPTQNYVFARVGVKIAGVEDLLFSPLVKVTF